MTATKKTLLLSSLLIAFLVHTVLAQTTGSLPQLNYKGQDFIRYIMKNVRYQNDIRSCDKSRALVAIRFKLNAKGKLTFMEVAGTAGDTTKNHLLKLLRKTDGYWKPRYINGKATASNLIIQPIMFALEDCEYNEYRDRVIKGLEQDINAVLDVAKGGEDCTILNLIVVTGRIKALEKEEVQLEQN